MSCPSHAGALSPKEPRHSSLGHVSDAEDSSQDADELRASGEDAQDEIADSQHTSGEKLSPALQAGPQPDEEREAAGNEEEVAGGSDHRNLTGSEFSCRQQQTQLSQSCRDEIADEEVHVVPEGGDDAKASVIFHW